MRRSTTAGLLSLAMVGTCAAGAHALEGRPGTGMLVIAHRGAPVYAGEGTIAGYERAANLGADLLEGDLVMSKDGRAVLLHDIELSRVTDVANRPIFGGKYAARTFNGVEYWGYWVDDFTWEELQSLRTKDGQALVTLEDLIWFSQQRGSSIYMEIKESAYFQSRGLDPVATVANILKSTGEAHRGSRVWIQSFNAADLQALRPQIGNRLVYLTRTTSPEDAWQFPAFRQFADVLAVPTTRARRGLVQQARAADLGVHVWTLRGSRDAYRKAAAIGADGVITDFPDLGVDVRSRIRMGDRPTGIASRIENGNAIVTWSAVPGSWYAVTFDFGDPLLAPTVWTNAGSASMPMAEAKAVDITVSRFDGSRLGADAYTRAALETDVYASPRVRTRIRNVKAVVSSDAKTRISGVMEKLSGKKWVPLRKTRGWLRGRGDDGTDVRRSFTSDKRGEFFLTVQVRDDILAGYLPERSWMIGVTASETLKPASSEWVKSEEGPPPAPTKPKKKSKAAALGSSDVTVRIG